MCSPSAERFWLLPLQIACYLFLYMRFPTEITCRFTIFAEVQQQKKAPFEDTFQVVFGGYCRHHHDQTNLKHYVKPSARNLTAQSSSMVLNETLSCLHLCSHCSLQALWFWWAKEDTDVHVSLWIAASEFMTDGKPTEELKSCESTHSL